MTTSILVTGAAGFIGYHLSLALSSLGYRVIGLDNFNDYYALSLKKSRAALLAEQGIAVERLDISDSDSLAAFFTRAQPSIVVHLAAQAGVRYSLTDPESYIRSNITGFFNILENCRHHMPSHLIYASSSSVYGASCRYPYAESDAANHPVSLYAATKKSNEAMAHSYAHLFGLPVTGLRFFTVYGAWGRPDMAYYSFTRKILAGEPIPIFNNGAMLRDFTYIDDIIGGILGLLDRPPSADKEWDAKNPANASSSAPWRLYNIGNNAPVPLEDFITILEDSLGVAAIRDYQPMQVGDVVATAADTSLLQDLSGFRPSTSLAEGIAHFTRWYRSYHGQNPHT